MISQASFAIIFNSSQTNYLRLLLAKASYGTVYACPCGGSKAFTVLVFRAVVSSNFSTTDYYTVELAPTVAKLTVLLRSLLQGKAIFLQHSYYNFVSV